MILRQKHVLILSLTFIALLFLFSSVFAYLKFRDDLIHAQLANQQKMTRIVNQSLNLYFDKLKFAVEVTVLQTAFRPDVNRGEDAMRYEQPRVAISKASLASQGISKVLENPRKAVDPSGSLKQLSNWQIYKALPEVDSRGEMIARPRRVLARNILRTFKDIHYLFEMDINGDLVFLEPFEIQKNISSFNYEFRDYLQLVKACRSSVISEGYISHDQNRTQIITVATPIFDSTSKITKLFAVSVSASTLREKIFKALKESMDAQDGTVFYLIDRHGHVVASSSGKNVYFPAEGNRSDEQDQGNLRSVGFFREIEWIPDTLEKGNVWERETRSWQFNSLRRDFSGEYSNLNDVRVFGSFYPMAMIGNDALNWGILIETPKAQLLRSEHALLRVFAGAGLVLLAVLLILYVSIFQSSHHMETALHAKEEELRRVSAQVAHDIRSPLAALEVAAGDVSHLPEDKRILIRAAVGRIRDIANSLLSRQRGQAAGAARAAPEVASPQLLSSLIDPVVSEKRLQFRSHSRVEIELRLDASSYGLFAAVQPVEFKRLVSNLINNAVEAFGDGHGSVSIGLASSDGRALVSVQDNGKGIPPDVLAKLGRRGETHGKVGGSGLGLHHARTSAESWGGNLEIYSEVGKGTTTTVFLPLSPAPEWFVPELRLAPGEVVVILDDDASIHQIWQGRLDALRAGERGVEVVHVSTPDEIRGWVKGDEAKAQQALYLFDYELLGYHETGLSLAEELALGDRVVLVTSRYEEPKVLEGCRRLKARLIPKGLAGSVPMRMAAVETPERERLDAVLIDDDPLTRMNWKMSAKRVGKSFKAYSDAASFLAELDAGALSTDTPIYIDSNLADGVKGEDVAREISRRGFAEIRLATGHEPSAFPAMPHIREVVGKTPPWDVA